MCMCMCSSDGWGRTASVCVSDVAWLGSARLGLAWRGLAWLGLAWLGLAWLDLVCDGEQTRRLDVDRTPIVERECL